MASRKRGMPSRFSKHSPQLMRQWATPPDRNTWEFLQKFNESPRMAVIDVISCDLAIIKGRLFEIDADGNEEERPTHPFVQFIEQPNPMYELTASAIWRLFSLFLEIKGEAYCLIERGLDGAPKELWPVPPNWVMETPHDGFPYYRIVSARSGYSAQVDIKDVFVQKSLNPADPYGRGKGTAESIADEIEIDEYAAKFQKRFFFNDATPSIVLKMGDATDPSTYPNQEQKDTFVERWVDKLRGLINRNGVIAVDGDVDVIKLSESMKDVDMQSGRRAIADSILEHYGVPREIMGITENSNRATSENAQFIYTTRVLKKRILAREEAINTQLVSWYGSQYIWRFDEIVPDDSTFKLQVSNEGIARGTLTINEWREMNGLDPTNTGDVFLIPSGVIAVGKEGNIAQAVADASATNAFGFPATADDEGSDDSEFIKSKKAKKKPEEAKAKRLVSGKRSVEEINKDIKKGERAIGQVFKEYYKEFSEALPPEKTQSLLDELRPKLTRLFEASPDKTDYVHAARGMIEKELRNLIDWEKMSTDLTSNMHDVWDQIFEQATEGVVDVSRVSNGHGGIRMHQIVEDLKHSMSEKIARAAVDPNVSAGQLTDELTAVLNDKAHVKRLADDEAFITESVGIQERAKAEGYTSKTWVTMGDAKVRLAHRIVNGENVGINEVFSNGLLYPRDPTGSLAEIANCRCRCVYLYDD